VELILAVIGASTLLFAFGWLLGRATAPLCCPPGTWVNLEDEEIGTGIE
jgi:hypothetical protein